MLTILAVIVIAIAAILLGGVFSESIAGVVRRRIPDFSYDGDTFLLWGLLGITGLVLGLIVTYLVSRP